MGHIQNNTYREQADASIFIEHYTHSISNIEMHFPFNFSDTANFYTASDDTAKSNTASDANCKSTILKTYKVNNTAYANILAKNIFRHAKDMFPYTIYAQERKKRQLMALLAGTLVGVIGKELLDFFRPTHHVVDTKIRESIEKIVCEIANQRTTNFLLQFENFAKTVTAEYFDDLRREISTLARGSLEKTHAFKVIKAQCYAINGPDNCNNFELLGHNYVTLMGHGFENFGYRIQVQIILPKLEKHEGQFVTISPILLPYKNSWKVKEIHEEFLQVNTIYFNPKKCSGKHRVFICRNSYYVPKSLQTDPKFQTLNFEQKCIVEIKNMHIIISSHVQVTVQYMQPKIATTIFPAGVHEIKRHHVVATLILCDKETISVPPIRISFYNITEPFRANYSTIPLANINSDISHLEVPSGQSNFLVLIAIICTAINIAFFIAVLFVCVKKAKCKKNKSASGSLESIKTNI